MLLVQVHVAHTINCDKPAHHGDDDHHDQRKPVCHKGSDGHFMAGKNKFKVKHARKLKQGHAHDEAAAQFPTDAKNVDQQEQV